MATNVNVRFPDPLLEALDARVRQENLTRTELVKAAVAERIGRAPCGTCRDHALRAAEAEAELERVRADLDRLRADLARLTGTAAPEAAPPRSASGQDALVTHVLASSEDFPVTRDHLSAVTGYSGSYVRVLLGAALERGHVVNRDWGKYWLAPGVTEAALREDVEDAKRAHAAARKDARHQAAARPAARAEPSAPAKARPASPSPAAARPDRTRDIPDRVAALQEAAAARGMTLKVASELRPPVPPGTAVFMEPGAAPVVMQAVPDEVPDPSRKRGRTSPAGRSHR